MTYTTTAVILKYQKFKDFDRVYTVYSKDYGKLTLLARGTNKIKSKLAGHMELCVLSELMIASGRGLEILAQAKTLESFCAIRFHAERLEIASVFFEGLDKLTQSHQTDEQMYYLLIHALYSLESTDLPLDILYQFLLHMLILLGHAPDMRHERILKPYLVANIFQDGIIIERSAQMLILDYLYSALDEYKLHSLTKALSL